MARTKHITILIGVAALSTGCGSSAGSSAAGGATAAGGSVSVTGGATSMTGGSAANTGGASTAGGSSAQGGDGLSSGGATTNGGTAGADAGPGDAGDSLGGAPSTGGNTSLAGSAGASGSSAGGGNSASCSGLLLCDDFESYGAAAEPAGPWAVTKRGSGTVTIDTTHASSGTKAAHFHGTPNGDTVYMAASSAPVFPVTGDTLYVRYLLYVDTWATPAAGQAMHERLAWIGSSGMLQNTDGSGYNMETYNGVGIERIASGYFRDTSMSMTAADNNVKQWVCWEFEIDNKATKPVPGGGTVLPHIWRNGTELTLQTAGSTEKWNPVPWNMLQFSLFTYQSSTVAVDFWLDDVAMSKTFIPCPTPK